MQALGKNLILFNWVHLINVDLVLITFLTNKCAVGDKGHSLPFFAQLMLIGQKILQYKISYWSKVTHKLIKDFSLEHAHLFLKIPVKLQRFSKVIQNVRVKRPI